MAFGEQKRESKFQAQLVLELKSIFPGAEIIHLGFQPVQGYPDLLILFRNRWAALEVKRSSSAPHRPNQDYYKERFSDMSYCNFIFPENKEEILLELQQALGS